MAEHLELIPYNYYIGESTTSHDFSHRNETDISIVYREIDGLNRKISKEEGGEANIMVVPELEEALLTCNMNQLKRLMVDGAPYLYEAYNKHRPIEMSAFYSRSDIIKIILTRHSKERTGNQATFFDHAALALYQACISNSKEIARMLIDTGAPIISAVHPHVAAQHGSWSVLDVLLREQALNINERDEHCLTPLHYAAKRGYAPTVAFLLAWGADPNARCELDGKVPLHLACEDAAEDVIYLLVTNAADIDVVDNSGYTALLIAAENGKENAVSILANAGANLDMRNEHGCSALILAAINGHASVVRELITNGASIDITDNGRYNALERGILNRKDSATAMIIRLTHERDFLLYYTEAIEVSIHKLLKFEMEKSLTALLDRMIIIDEKCHCTVLTKYLDLDLQNNTPADPKYRKNSMYLLQRITELSTDKIAHHGVIRLLVDYKMKKFGYYILSVKVVTYLLFLIALTYSLINAANQVDPYLSYLDGVWNHLRIVAESFVLIYFIVNLITEFVEFSKVVMSTYSRLKDKQIAKQTEHARLNSENIDFMKGKLKKKPQSISSSLANCFPIRAVIDYLREQSNYLDLLSLTTLALLIPLRLTSQHVQWVFATFAFLFNSLRLFNYISIVPVIGPYSNIFYKIITKDVPKFALMFLIALLIFTGSFFIALRTPYSQQGLFNNTYMENRTLEIGVNSETIWILFSGFRILLESNVMEENYLYKNLNWLAAMVYLTFLFLTVVVFLNVFIAQLSDRYAKVRENAEKTFAWHRLNFIIQLQKSSLLSLCYDFRKKSFIEQLQVKADRFSLYFGTTNMLNYHSMALERGVDEMGLLSQIKQQVKLARKTRDLSHTMKLMQTTHDVYESLSTH